MSKEKTLSLQAACDMYNDLLAENKRLTASIESKDEIIRSQRTAYFQLQARVEALDKVVAALRLERKAAREFDMVHNRDFTLAQRKTDEALEALEATEQEDE
jgi:hypothetical protein